MNTNITLKIGEVVAEDYRAASVFSKFGIDYCCGGQKTISDACRKKQVDPKEVVKALDEALKTKEPRGVDFNAWPMDLLADYIEKTHHTYVQKKIVEIKPLLEKLCKVHGNRYAFLHKLQSLFNEVSGELLSHLNDEENLLFPMIRKKAQDPHLTIPRELISALKKMETEHDFAGDAFKKMAELTDQFTPPPTACTTHRVTYAMLKEFEEDLHLHVHLENNILFPGFLKGTGS